MEMYTMIKKLVIASGVIGTLSIAGAVLASTNKDVKPTDNNKDHRIDCRHLSNDEARQLIRGEGDAYKLCRRPTPTPSPTPSATPVPTAAPTTAPTVINNTTNTTIPGTTTVVPGATTVVPAGTTVVQTPSTGVLPDTGGSAQ